VHPGVTRPDTAAPNDLWTADFQGPFRAGNGRYCYPLTIADQPTRYPLVCHGLLSTETVTAKPVFERAFREYGLPVVIRTDNRVPFATQAIHGLSYLNVCWMRLGIVHQRIRPGRPQENGAHERMHRTLKRQAVKPVRASCAAQQRNFDAFRREYNTGRPHERLGQQPPASRYGPSPRPYPERLTPPEYPGHFVVKKATTGGTFRFQNRLLYLAKAMVDQHIGLEEPTTACGRSTSGRCCWRPSTSATTSSRADPSVTHVPGHLCYPCSRLRSGSDSASSSSLRSSQSSQW